MKKLCRKHILAKMGRLKGLWFHIAGIACIIWFLVRVLPAPHRARYPCQQVSISVALTYIAFWSALFSGLSTWIRKSKQKTGKIVPTIAVLFIVVFTITGAVFGGNFNNDTLTEAWTPIPKDPMGTPFGINPGRVVWVWDPDATESDLNGYWWSKENNNQDVINSMFSTGLQGLTGAEDDETAWDLLFKHFNEIHGFGDIGYQTGEKIAIKINLNNCWVLSGNSYTNKDNERDASPYVVKALLNQLVNTVGIAQEDITVYDASREMGNWFYRRVYYETYPALTLVPEYPDINYVDSTGGAPGRQGVEPSSHRIYFADNTGIYRTLPTCVVDAKYIINMPLLKRHPIQQGVTLSGKNLFGTFIEPVSDIHDYHEAAFTLGNPAPQVDLLAHKEIGGKTLLYLGDGLFGTKIDHSTIAKFQMYPFNNDWTNSLFFSQDPVAIDSVMYDFLHAEGTNPVEGSQYYLHQAATPPPDVYDPENDGIYLSTSLGVHEHWDTSVDIFSSERYSGPSNNGIDFIALDEEYARPAIIITKPLRDTFYMYNQEKRTLPMTVIVGRIDVETQTNGFSEDIEKVEFYLDNRLQYTDQYEPYKWAWEERSFFIHTITAIAYETTGDTTSTSIRVWKIG